MKGLSILMPVGGILEQDIWRSRAHEWIIERYKALLPQAELCFGLSKAEPYSRSEARNDAFAQSTGDMLLVADADTVINLGQITKAIQLIREAATPWVIPYTIYYNLSQQATVYLIENAPPSEYIPEPDDEDAWEHRIENSPGGFQVLPRAAWEAVGGFDELFRGWAFEDDAFRCALDRMWGKHTRGAGAALHCWHERGDADFSQPFMEHNRQRLRQYQRGQLP
jgi:GT2 family glycosyltransferase